MRCCQFNAFAEWNSFHSRYCSYNRYFKWDHRLRRPALHVNVNKIVHRRWLAKRGLINGMARVLLFYASWWSWKRHLRHLIFIENENALLYSYPCRRLRCAHVSGNSNALQWLNTIITILDSVLQDQQGNNSYSTYRQHTIWATYPCIML